MSLNTDISGASLVIDVKGLTKIYGQRTVVDHFDLRVPKGAVYGFLGPNGSGKTTTLRMICGLLKPEGGSGTCLGWDVIEQSDRIKTQVGYMTQRFSLWEDLTIAENLDFVARMYGLDNRKDRVKTALKSLGLYERKNQLAGTLSGGWKQRLALSACMLHDPKLLLLDEPTAGVDPKARREFWETIHDLSDQGVTVLVSTHYMDEAVQCDFIAYIAYGKKLIDGPSGEIASKIGLSTWKVEGPGLGALSKALKSTSGVEQVARFGTSLHISGPDQAVLEAAIAPWRDHKELVWTPITSGLEEAFIHLMKEVKDNFA
ncbi:MAG: multidrug ABC transporter ATP-binding protein [Robiginitomaculum sp.]|nr:MAG: multidrug ABC transporter ATP-binding protein [Robiginitomaculum sp.]